MKLTLTRHEYREDGIFGDLHNEDGELLAVTLEHAFIDIALPGHYEPKIPSGEYTCVHHAPAHLLYETIEIKNVPGHSGILFHVGNFNHDSDGCVLLGQTVSILKDNQKMISGSRAAFAAFMQRVQDVNYFTLEVI